MSDTDENKRLIINFVGGDWDGRTIDSESSDPTERQMVEIQRSFFLSRPQTIVGQSMTNVERLLRGELDANDLPNFRGTKRAKYTVLDRMEDENCIYLRIQYSVWEKSDDSR